MKLNKPKISAIAPLNIALIIEVDHRTECPVVLRISATALVTFILTVPYSDWRGINTFWMKGSEKTGSPLSSAMQVAPQKITTA